MTRNNLHKELLSELFIGNNKSGMNSDILNTEEVKSMMYHQWKNPHEVDAKKKPDFKQLFEKIRPESRDSMSDKSTATQFLISEIKDLRQQNNLLKRKASVVLAIAASILLLLGVSSIIFLNKTQVFKQTFTENIVPKGQKSSVVLPDGTRVYLNSGSILRYDNFFGKKYRTLELAGEAYFEVTRNEKMPFIIKTEDLEVEVLGTKFNVLAYPEDDVVETTVTEGEVSVTEIHGRSSVNLKANQKATFHKSSQLLLMNEVNTDLYTSWKEDFLSFDNSNFADVIKKLERWYDVDIQVEGTDSITDRFTLTVRSESLREVLELISLTADIDYDISPEEVTIKYLK